MRANQKRARGQFPRHRAGWAVNVGSSKQVENVKMRDCIAREFSKDFIKLRDYIARQRAYAYNEHFNSSVNMAMSMFKLSTTSRWALMAARGWARLILYRRRDLINDRPNCVTVAMAPIDEVQERYHFDNPTAHTSGAYQHSKAAYRTCFDLYFLLITKHRPLGAGS